MEARGIAGGTVIPLFHDQFAGIALVCLESVVAHRGPAFAAIEKIPHTDVQRTARRPHLGGRRSDGSRTCRSAAAATGSSAGTGRHHTRLPNSFAVGHFATHLNDELLLAVAEPGRERVGCFCVVIDTELSAECHSRLRPHRITQRPARDTRFVHSLVPDVTVAGIPEPVPEIRETLLVVGPHRRRSEE